MSGRRWFPVLLLVAIPFLSGWFHVLSQEAWFAANPHLDFDEVVLDPVAYRGETLLLSGQVAERRDNGATLKILCYPADEKDRPIVTAPSCGRFLLQTQHRLDTERFAVGRRVTLTATVTGDERQGAPVFTLGEIYPWPDPDARRERVYPPSPWYDPWCGPWRFDPWCDRFRYPYRSGWGLHFGWGW